MRLKSKAIKCLMTTLLVASMSITAWAKVTAPTSTLTLEQAVSRAISSNSQKEIYGGFIEAYEELNQYNQDYFNGQFRNNKLQERIYNYKMHYSNDKVAYDTTNLYLSVIALNNQIEMLTKQVGISEKELEIAALKKEQGYLSALDYNQKENEWKQQQANLEMAKSNLETAALNFKKMTNMDITKYILDTDFKLEEPDLKGKTGAYFDQKLEEFYNIQQEGINVGELNLYGMFDILPTGESITTGQYLLQEAGVDANRINLEELKKSLHTNLMSSYSNLTAYKAAVENCELKIEAAEQQIDSLKVKYEQGYITKLQLEQSELNILQLRSDKFNKEKTYLTTKMVVEEPNILAFDYLGAGR